MGCKIEITDLALGGLLRLIAFLFKIDCCQMLAWTIRLWRFAFQRLFLYGLRPSAGRLSQIAPQHRHHRVRKSYINLWIDNILWRYPAGHHV